ncbi:MAG: hypothetical protein EOM68_32090, partial [Spirochaetia bacterium]|nr:hypothetical protein [Spirochaetia bacterium]
VGPAVDAERHLVVSGEDRGDFAVIVNGIHRRNSGLDRIVADHARGAVFLIAFILILRLLWKKGGTGEVLPKMKGYLDYLMTAGGIAAVIIGAQLVVNAAVGIATALGVSAFVIGMTLVAVGTSLPELATSVVAIARGQGGISVGNLLGSNIFNLLFVMGIIAIITPVPIDAQGDLLVMALFSAAAIPITLAGEKLTRPISVIILIGYCVYIGMLAGLI